MIDVDCFKKVNDTYVHDAGDTVLKTLADILKTHPRQSDICVRLGGEEFLLMMDPCRQEMYGDCGRTNTRAI
jgi:diguanylate cyclase (GGDEF)-like protein